MTQPFYYGNGYRAMPGDRVQLPNGEIGTIRSLWWDDTSNEDATLADGRRVNLALCSFVAGQ